MGSLRVDTVPLIAAACVVSAYSGHGIRGDAVPQTGLHGASILWGAGSNITLPDEAADEFRALILTRPAGLPGLVITEDSAVEVPEDSPVGVHAGTWRGYKNGAVFGPDPAAYSIIIGAGLSGTATPDAAAASGVLTPGGISAITGSAAPDAAVATGTLTSESTTAITGAAVPGGAQGSGVIIGAAVVPTVLSAARQYRVNTDAHLDAYSINRGYALTWAKDPGATLDYSIDWTDWLADVPGDTIATLSVTKSTGLQVPDTAVRGAVTAIVAAAGALGNSEYATLRIITAAGRIDERTITLLITDR